MADAPKDITDAEHVVAPSTRPSLGQDEYAHIIRACGILCIRLRRVGRLFHRLGSEPATWTGCVVFWPADVRSLDFLCEQALPALVRAAALSTHAVARGEGVAHHALSRRRAEVMPAMNTALKGARDWMRPRPVGVSSNVRVDGTTARRADETIPGMAAVCAAGPVPRDAAGRRTFGLRIEATTSCVDGGIYVGFVATPPDEIDFGDALGMWGSAMMWRLVGSDFYANVPLSAHPIARVHSEERIRCPEGTAWRTDQLEVGDELRLTAQYEEAESMQLSATLNGEPVVLPMRMQKCLFAMELWPYVAVAGRVTAVRLLAA